MNRIKLPMISTLIVLPSSMTSRKSRCRIGKSGFNVPCLVQSFLLMVRPRSAYLMQVAVANNVKDRFYDYELPLLEDVSNYRVEGWIHV